MSDQVFALEIVISGINYDMLVNDPTMVGGFQTAIKFAVVGQLGQGATAENVVVAMSPGSVLAKVEILPPYGTYAKDIAAGLTTVLPELQDKLFDSINDVDGI